VYFGSDLEPGHAMKLMDLHFTFGAVSVVPFHYRKIKRLFVFFYRKIDNDSSI
jgi:hypothetical protein